MYLNEYVRLTNLCRKENCFQAEYSFTEERDGTVNENLLTPFLANLVISRFETETSNIFLWLKYVDDVFAISNIRKSITVDFVSQVSERFLTDQFTFEEKIRNNFPCHLVRCIIW